MQILLHLKHSQKDNKKLIFSPFSVADEGAE